MNRPAHLIIAIVVNDVMNSMVRMNMEILEQFRDPINYKTKQAD
jgi:hypothetical protein